MHVFFPLITAQVSRDQKLFLNDGFVDTSCDMIYFQSIFHGSFWPAFTLRKTTMTGFFDTLLRDWR